MNTLDAIYNRRSIRHYTDEPATELGLATVWIGIYPLETNINAVRKVLDMPDYVVPMAMVYVGHGAGELEGRCRYNEKRVYWQKYDPNRKHKAKHKPKVGHYL